MERSDWDEIKSFADPLLGEIDQPHATLPRVEIVIKGDESTDVGAAFLCAGQTAVRNNALLVHAIELITEHANSQYRGSPPGGA